MVKQLVFCYEGTQACATCWMAFWHLDIMHLCYEECEGHGTANGLLQPRMERNWPKEAMHRATDLLGQGLLMEPRCFNLSE